MSSKKFGYALLSLFFSGASAFAAVPRFSDYKVEEVYKGVSRPLVETNSAGDRWNDLRKRAAVKQANFAGHYILFTGGCGGASMCGEVIDAKSGGVVTSLPNAYETYDEETEESFVLDYAADSRLIVVMGIAQDSEVDVDGNKVSRIYRIRYYEFNGRDFRLVMSNDK